MSANINSSKIESSNYDNTNNLHNNYSAEEYNNFLNIGAPKIRITITKHLCNPCPRYYTDVFRKVLFVCKHPSHLRKNGVNNNTIWTNEGSSLECDSNIPNLQEYTPSNHGSIKDLNHAER